MQTSFLNLEHLLVMFHMTHGKKLQQKCLVITLIVVMNLEGLLCQLIWFLRKLMAIDWQQNCKMVTMELLVSLFMLRQKLHV